MTLDPFKRRRTRIRPRVAAVTALCGAAIVIGSLLTWLNAHGAGPALGMDHTSLRQMLREGAWLTIIGGVSGLVSAFWLRRRTGGRPGHGSGYADA